MRKEHKLDLKTRLYRLIPDSFMVILLLTAIAAYPIITSLRNNQEGNVLGAADQNCISQIEGKIERTTTIGDHKILIIKDDQDDQSLMIMDKNTCEEVFKL